jgi:hypothetical protein
MWLGLNRRFQPKEPCSLLGRDSGFIGSLGGRDRDAHQSQVSEFSRSCGEGSAQAAGVPASNIDDDIVVLRSELADQRPDRAPLQTHCRIARLTQLDAAKLGEGDSRLLLVPVNQEDVTTGRSPDTQRGGDAFHPLLCWSRGLG